MCCVVCISLQFRTTCLQTPTVIRIRARNSCASWVIVGALVIIAAAAIWRCEAGRRRIRIPRTAHDGGHVRTAPAISHSGDRPVVDRLRVGLCGAARSTEGIASDGYHGETD